MSWKPVTAASLLPHNTSLVLKTGLVLFQDTVFFFRLLSAGGFQVRFCHLLGLIIHHNVLFMDPDHAGTEVGQNIQFVTDQN